MLELNFLEYGNAGRKPGDSNPCGYAILKEKGVYYVSQAPSGYGTEYILNRMVNGREDIEVICVVRTDEWIRKHLEEHTRRLNGLCPINV